MEITVKLETGLLHCPVTGDQPLARSKKLVAETRTRHPLIRKKRE